MGDRDSLYLLSGTVEADDSFFGAAGENFAVIRQIALNLLNAYPAMMSLARKRRKCEYDADFLSNMLFSQFAL